MFHMWWTGNSNNYLNLTKSSSFFGNKIVLATHMVCLSKRNIHPKSRTLNRKKRATHTCTTSEMNVSKNVFTKCVITDMFTYMNPNICLKPRGIYIIRIPLYPLCIWLQMHSRVLSRDQINRFTLVCMRVISNLRIHKSP